MNKKRLIELLDEKQAGGYAMCAEGCEQFSNEEIADHLIVNGVTFRRHGRWVPNGSLDEYTCSECGEVYTIWDGKPEETFRFCPDCGARMNLED